MGLLYFQKITRGQNSNKFCRKGHGYCFAEACMLCAGFFLFCINSAFGQEPLLDKIISIPKQTTTVYEALNLVSQKAGCYFIYESETVKNDKRVKLHAENQPLRKVLDNLLADPTLQYKVIGTHILIYKTKKEQAPATRLPQDIPVKDTISQVIIRGHIYDDKNKSVIPFATIGIVEENIGTITNSDGFFMLKIPATLSGTSLIVSHLGYMSQPIPVQLLSEQQVDIYLERRVFSIQEVIIRYVDPVLVIQKAIGQRKMNYALDPVYLTTFYREGVQKNNEYISYSEAVFKVYKSPFGSSEYSDQVKLLKSRKVQNASPGDTVFLKLKAGVQSALQLDIVKRIPDFLDLESPTEYIYKYFGLVSYQDRDAYAVTFKPEAGNKTALYNGTVFIDKEKFAILGADFEINPECLDLATQGLVLKKSPKLIVKFEKINYSVSYKSFNGRYYLNHVRCDIRVKTRLRNHLSNDYFNTFLELAICKIDTTGVVKFPKQEILKPNAIFSDQVFNRNDDFWGDLNIITPELKLNEAMQGIMGKIEEIVF